MTEIFLPLNESLIINGERGRIIIESENDGIKITNVSEDSTAVYKQKESRETFLFTDAKPIYNNDNFSLCIGVNRMIVNE
jgi:hypothetical protein